MDDNNRGITELRKLCSRMKELQDEKEKQETALALTNAQLEDLRKRQIPSMMETLQIKNMTFDGLGRVQLSADLYATTREGQRDAAIQWLRDCGYEQMVTETVNASTLKGLFRRLMEQGVEIPDNIFNVTPFTRASIVKA